MAKVLHYLRRNAIGALALFVALGGTGYAATGGFSQGGTLRACVNAEGGMRLLKSGRRCHKGQKAVAWNQQGIKGATGSPGAPGAQGSQGPIGPSNAYETSLGATGPIASTPEFSLKTIATLAVPSGTYVASAKPTIENNTAEEEAKIVCDLTNDQSGEEDADEITLVKKPNEGFFDRRAIALEASAKLPAGGKWQLQCSTGSKHLELFDIKIQAIQVGAVTRTFLP